MAGRTDEALRVEELQARARELDADPGHKAATVNRAVRVRVRAASRGAAYVRLPTLARGPRNVTRASPPNSSARRPSIRRRASSLSSKRSRFRAHRCVPRLQRRLPRSRYRQLPSDISPGRSREASQLQEHLRGKRRASQGQEGRDAGLVAACLAQHHGELVATRDVASRADLNPQLAHVADRILQGPVPRDAYRAKVRVAVRVRIALAYAHCLTVRQAAAVVASLGALAASVPVCTV